MTRLALTLLLLATTAQAAPEPQNLIQIERDSQRGVTCYILNGVGISRVPDSQLKPEPKPTPAGAPDRPTDERYSM